MASSAAWTLGRASNPGWTLTVVRDDAARAADLPLADLSDADLIAASLDGRRDAFDVIVERHRRAIYQLCYRFVGNHEDASDLSQEVFVKAWRGLRSFKGEAALLNWLYRIAVDVCLK